MTVTGILPDGRPFYRVDDPYYLGCYTPNPGEPYRTLPDGREVVVVPHSAGGGQIGVTTNRAAGGWSGTWLYSRAAVAVAAAWAWDGTGDPAGWNRHPWTARRRPDGTPASEFVRP